MTANQTTYIFIDESGTLPDPNNRYVVFTAVASESPETLSRLTKTIRKKIIIRKHKETLSEIKFYRSGERTKKEFLWELSRLPIQLFALIVDKRNQRIPDSPINYALLVSLLINECIEIYNNSAMEVVIDKHFSRITDEEECSRTLSALLNSHPKIRHADSKTESPINAADMVAGSVLWAYSGKKRMFYETIASKMVSEKIVNWKEAKTTLFHKLKKLH